MRLDDVAKHYLLDVKNNLSPHTLASYRHKLGALLSLLDRLCGVTELEQVTVFHLRQCVDHLLTAPIDPTLGTGPGNGRKPRVRDNPVTRLKLPKPTKRVALH
jgi:Phage integrase, N-terminal SAM-like domain